MSRLRCPRCKGRDLRVAQRLCNHSAFNGYHWTPSDYSELRCLDCRNRWRTKADVSHLTDLPIDWTPA